MTLFDHAHITSDGGRTPGDAYYTPPDLARRLVGELPIAPWALVVEPSVGAGAFLRALPPCRTVAIDLDPASPGLAMADVALGGRDLLSVSREEIEEGWNGVGSSWCIGNQPYCHAEAHIRHCLGLTRHVAMLLRAGIMESRARVDLWAGAGSCVRGLWILAERPTFTGGGTDSAAYAWIWWDNQWTGSPEIVRPGWSWR